MAAEGGLGPTIPPRPTVIKPVSDDGDVEANSRSSRPVPTRPPPLAPTRPAPAIPPPHSPVLYYDVQGVPQERLPPVDRPVPPRPQPAASNTSRHASAKSKGRPVITVVDARPMNQVGFRDVDPGATKDSSTTKPEITVLGARPMSEVGFRSDAMSDKPRSPVPSPTMMSRGEGLPSNRPTSHNEASSVMMRHKSRGPAPPRPSSMPVKPPPPTRVSSIRQQPAASQNTKSSFQYDRIRLPGMEVESSVDDTQRPPPMPPRPQSLQIANQQHTTEGLDPNSPSSGYGSELTTSESHPSLSSGGSPADQPPPPRRKPMGVQVLPMGPEMLKRISSRGGGPKSPYEDGEQVVGAPPHPVPSPRAARKSQAPPSPRPREHAIISPSQPQSSAMTDVEANNNQITETKCETDAQDHHQHGVMVLPPMPNPRAPSPKPRTPRQTSPTPVSDADAPPTVDPGIVIDPRILAEFGPETPVDKSDENQNNQDTYMMEKQVTTERVEDIVLSDMCRNPPPTKPRPMVKPKPVVKPKPSVAAKPKPAPMAKPPRQTPVKPSEGPKVQSPPANRLYPLLPQPSEDQAQSPDSQELQVNVQTPELRTSPHVSPRSMLVDHTPSQPKLPRPPPPKRVSSQITPKEDLSPVSPEVVLKVETTEVKTSPHVSPRAMLVDHTLAHSPPARPQSPEKAVSPVHKNPPHEPEQEQQQHPSSPDQLRVDTSEVKSSPHVSPRAMLVDHTLTQAKPTRPESPEKKPLPDHVEPLDESKSNDQSTESKPSQLISPRAMLVEHALTQAEEQLRAESPPDSQFTETKTSPVVAPRSMLVQHAVSQKDPPPRPQSPEKKLPPANSSEVPSGPEEQIKTEINKESKINTTSISSSSMEDTAKPQEAPSPPKSPAKKLYPTTSQSLQKVLPMLSPTKEKGGDSFYDDFDDNEPAIDPFYNKKNGRHVVDESLFSLVVSKKDDDPSNESHLKKYFSQSELREKENTDPGVDFYKNHPEILTDGGPSPTKLKRPTIIRPKKVPVPVKAEESNGKEGSNDASGSSPEKSESGSTEEPKEETPVVAPVAVRRPTIIRPQKLRPQSQSIEKVEEPGASPVEVTGAPVRPKKPLAPPPVKPKPPSPGRTSQVIVTSPLPSPASPPKTRPKPAIPPPTKPKPKRPVSMASALPDKVAPIPVDRTHPPSPTFAARKVHTTQQLSPVMVAKMQQATNLPRTDSLSSVEENENMMNELRARKESSSPDKVRHPSTSSSVSSEGAAHEVERRHAKDEQQQEEGKVKPPAVMRKSWVPPGAVRVMGTAPPPLPRTGPVAVSTPDLRMVPAQDEEPPVSSFKAVPPQSRRSQSPTFSTEDRMTPTSRPKSMSMMALHKPTFEHESVVVYEEQIKEEKKWVQDAPEKPARPVSVRRPAPPRPAGLPTKVRPVSMEVSQDVHAEPETIQKRPPSRPGPPPSPTARPTSEASLEDKVEPEPAQRRPPSRPGPPPSPTARPTSAEVPADDQNEPEQKRPPVRPGPPPSPTAKKTPPRRAPPPQVPRSPQPTSPPGLPARPGPGHPLYHYVVQGPHGIALFDYSSTAADELSFKAGDVIELEEQISDEWMIGRNVDKKGMFPAAYIDVIEAPPVTNSKQTHPASPAATSALGATSTGPHCVARFDYDTGEECDLCFVSGDVISLTGRSGDEWLKGCVGGKEGLFPAAFVEIIEDLPPPGSPGQGDGEGGGDTDENTVTASYDYNGEEGDLSFKSGDKVKVLSKLSDDWLFGQSSDGSTGTFPVGFVDRMPPALPVHVPPSASTEVHDTAGPTDGAGQVEIKGDEPHCVAEHGFKGNDSGDLSFNKGDRIILTERTDAEWLKGTIGGRTGAFPQAYVTIVKDLEAPKSKEGVVDSKDDPQKAHPPTPVASGKAVAMYEFEGNAEGDLALKVGDEVILLEKIGADWYNGKIGENSGLFPAGFVQVLLPLADSVLDPPDSFV